MTHGAAWTHLGSRSRPRGRPRRRGSIYVLVLIVSMSLMIVGLSALAVEQARARGTTRESDWVEARLLAESAVEAGMFVLKEAAESGVVDWRQAMHDAGADLGPTLSLGGGTSQWSLQDDHGGRMSTKAEEPIYVVGTGSRGTTTQTLRAIVRPSGPAYNALALGMHAKSDMVFESGVVVQSDRAIGANGDITATVASIFSPVEAQGEITGGTYHATALPFGEARGVPGDAVFDYYVDEATIIDVDDLPGGLTTRRLEQIVLSPASNPYGLLDPEGLYFIDCDGLDLLIRNLRVHGTLIIKGAGANSRVAGSVFWTPAVSNFPVLLVKGRKPFGLALSATDLSEAAVGTNLNPAGSPYLGEEDADLSDTYPSVIRGLIYTDHDLVLQPSHNRIEGVILSGAKVRSDPSAVLDLTYDPAFAEDPPPGFFVPDGNIRLAASSWARVTD